MSEDLTVKPSTEDAGASPATGSTPAPAPAASNGIDPSTSPLSARLHVATPREPIVVPPMLEREHAARKRVGSRIKGWRLLRLLGVGPVTAAYEAIHGEKDSGDRGVLRLLTDMGNSERAKGQYLRAAYAANRFRHPRVVPIVADGVDDDGLPYVIRAYIDAQSLADVVAEGQSAADENGSPTPRLVESSKVLRIMEQVLDALEIAHAHGVIHGAISPTNVLVTPRGSIRLVDFSTPPGASVMGQDVRDVLAEHRIGPFTAPERCAVPPEAPTEQTDVWGLAACAYFALSGKFPRGDKTGRAELATASAVPLREVVPSVPEAVALILDHALQREPELRYGSAYAMLGDVRRALAGRKPKLGEALRPIPSGSYRDVSLPSSRRVVLADSTVARPSQLGVPAMRTPESSARDAKRQRDEWRGNLLLIMAIALLVGVATFVVVRERVEDQRDKSPQQNGEESR